MPQMGNLKKAVTTAALTTTVIVGGFATEYVARQDIEIAGKKYSEHSYSLLKNDIVSKSNKGEVIYGSPDEKIWIDVVNRELLNCRVNNVYKDGDTENIVKEEVVQGIKIGTQMAKQDVIDQVNKVVINGCPKKIPDREIIVKSNK